MPMAWSQDTKMMSRYKNDVIDIEFVIMDGDYNQKWKRKKWINNEY